MAANDHATLGGSGWDVTNPIIRPGFNLLGQSGVAAPVTGTLVKTTLASVPVPAGQMGPAGVLQIETLWSFTNNANAKTITIELGGQALFTVSAASNAIFQGMVRLHNRTMTSQVQYPNFATAPYGFGSGALNTWSIDMTQAQTLTITGTLGNTGDTITLQGYSVSLLNP